MTYSDIFNLLEPLGYEQAAISWQGDKKPPDIFIRYYLVTGLPDCNYNGKSRKTRARYTFVVYDRSGQHFERIFKELQSQLEGKNGFKEFFNISDGYDTGHRFKKGDVYFYEER